MSTDDMTTESTPRRLTAWDRVKLARHPERPHTLDFIDDLMSDFVELRGDRLVALRYEDHNDTPAQIAEARKAAAERKSRQRQSRAMHADVPRDAVVTIGGGHGDVPSDARGEQPIAPSPGSPPEWWAGAVDAAAMVVGDVSDPAARWAEYFASRYRKGWSPNHTDAVGWLTTVVRRERREQADRGAPGSGSGPSSTQPRPARRDLTNYQP